MFARVSDWRSRHGPRPLHAETNTETDPAPIGEAGDAGADDAADDLFRPQALEAATTRFGAPVRPTGLAGWGLTAFLVALFVAIAVFLLAGRYARKETVLGVLQPATGAGRIASMTNGVVTQVYVADGEAVEAGAPILEVSTDRTIAQQEGPATTLSGLLRDGGDREAGAVLAQARARSEDNARSLDELRARRDGLLQDLAQLADSLTMQEKRVALTEETLEAGRKLHERELFSTLQLRQREEALISARQGVASIQREQRRNQASLRQLAAEEGRLKAQAQQVSSQLAIDQAQLAQKKAQLDAERSVVLVAAKGGRVTALQARPGTPVVAGRTIAVVLPPGSALQAELWAPSRAVGFLTVGAPVRLMYDAFPYQKFGVGKGVVASIAGAPTDPADLTVPIEAREALYRVLVTIEDEAVDGYGRKWHLSPGMRLSADLVLDDRSFAEWLFDPVIAAGRRSRP